MRTTFLIVLILLSLGTGIATAQHKQNFKSNPAERARKNTEWMKVELELSGDQERLAHAVNLKYAKLNQALADESGSRYTKRKQLKANMEAKDSEMKQILSAVQYDRYLTLKAEKQKNAYGK